jgi:hypothetical protein
MGTVELERTVVKSPPELWEDLACEDGLRRWLPDARVRAAEAPRRLEWDAEIASGVIELEASGWGTTVRALATPADNAGDGHAEVERRLSELLEDLGSSSLTSG